ncbi:hypothetical protein BKI52_33085 [marine bacterium AO1-C]|nr:hypothetical protein BKI52_33085 [marine bacterium AO1-C]
MDDNDDLTGEDLKIFEESRINNETPQHPNKPKVYLHLDWAADLIEKGVDIRNKIINPQQTNQPLPGLNYNPNPQPNPINQQKNGNKTALIAGGVMVALAGVLIYKKTQK